MKVLVVIPTLNEERHVGGVIASLATDLPRSADVTFVVADGGSTDRTRDIVQRLQPELAVPLHCIDNPQRLQGAGINRAVSLHGTDADVLVRCDAHASYPPGYVAQLLDALARTGADSIVVPMDSRAERGVQRAVALVSDTLLGSGGSAHRGGRRSGWVDHGHHAAIRLAAFRRAGGYDERYSHNEDAELDCRLRGHGARIYLDAGIRLGYAPRASFGAVARQYFDYGRGRSRTMRRHPGSSRLRQLAVPLHWFVMIASIAAWAVAPRNGWRWLWLAWPATYLLVLAAYSIALAVRHRSASALLTGPVAAVMHLAWASGLVWGFMTVRETPWRAGLRSRGALDAWLVDPSLFTAPYDAALSGGLAASGVRPHWFVRPLRAGEARLIDADVTTESFYGRTDGLDRAPSLVRAAGKGLAHLSGLASLVRRVRQARPDIVHFQWAVLPLFDAIAMLCIRRTCPVVMTVHDTVPFNGERISWWQTAGFDWPLRMADRLIVHTRSARETLLARGFDDGCISVVPHGALQLPGVTPKPPAPARPQTEGLDDSRWTCVVFGEIKPYKGIDVLIDAVARMPAERRAALRVIVAGRPRMDVDALRAVATTAGLDDQIEWRTWRHDEAEMAALFDEADAFVFPYRQIDASGVYFLVKGWQRWIVASDVGVFAEDMRGNAAGNAAGNADGPAGGSTDGSGAGRLVPPGDAAALADALADGVARRPVPDRTGAMDWSDIGRATRAVYQAALDRQPVAGTLAGVVP